MNDLSLAFGINTFMRPMDHYGQSERNNAFLRALLMLSLDRNCIAITSKFSRIDWDEVFRLAKVNKMQEAFIHINRCKLCRSYIPQQYRKKIFQLERNIMLRKLIIKNELFTVAKILKKIGGSAVLFKYVSLPRYKNIRGIDIDILVTGKVFSLLRKRFITLGYSEQYSAPKGFTYLHPGVSVSVDVHTMFAYPHYGAIRLEKVDVIKKYSLDILAHTNRRQKGVYHVVSKEDYLMICIVRFWYNDLGQGLFRLFEIVRFILSQKHAIDFDKIRSLSARYRIHHVVAFVLRYAFRSFNLDIPREVAQVSRLPYWKEVALTNFGMQMGVMSQDATVWHKRKHASGKKKYMLHFFIADLILDESASRWRLVRPRIVAFIARGIFDWIRLSY
jgi:hypothetical protein